MNAELPVNRGHIDGPNLVVPECVVCGSRHYHGADVTEGGRTTRAPHCRPEDVDGELPVEYAIDVQGGGGGE